MLAAFMSAVYISVRSNVRRDEEAADQRILYQMLVNIDYMDNTFKSLCYSAYTLAEVRTVMYLKEPDTYENCYSQLERLQRIQLQNTFVHSVQIYNYDKDVIYSTKNNFREDVSVRKILAGYGAAPRLKPILRQINNNGTDIFVLSYFMYDILNEDGRMNGALVMNIQLNWLLNNREPLKTSVFRGFLTPWRKLHLRNSLYNKELAIFSEEPLETRPGFPEVPYIHLSFSFAHWYTLFVLSLIRGTARPPPLRLPLYTVPSVPEDPCPFASCPGVTKGPK
jgi:hypothetical protein